MSLRQQNQKPLPAFSGKWSIRIYLTESESCWQEDITAKRRRSDRKCIDDQTKLISETITQRQHHRSVRSTDVDQDGVRYVGDGQTPLQTEA
jgi:hypothetical protein